MADITKVYLPKAQQKPNNSIWAIGVYMLTDIPRCAELFEVTLTVPILGTPMSDNLCLEMYCICKAVSIDYKTSVDMYTPNSTAALMVNANLRRSRKAGSDRSTAIGAGLLVELLRSTVDSILEKERSGVNIAISSVSEDHSAIVDATELLAVDIKANKSAKH